MDASESGDWIRVCTKDEVPADSVIGREINGREIAIYCLADGGYYATDDICTHEYAHLCEGWLQDGVIECPLHAGQFDVRTGKGLCAPIDTDLATFPVRVEGEDILVWQPHRV
jgi:MocE subfamily Rieske [2Fe-2S] domain protein